MADRYTTTAEPRQFKIFEQRLRNVPMKRPAPYQSHFSAASQLKRSKMVYSPAPQTRAPLSLRPTNANMQTQSTVQSTFTWNMRDDRCNRETFLGESNHPVGQSQTFGFFHATHFYQKMGCCPLRNPGTGISTPPYCTKPATGEMSLAEMKQVGKAKFPKRKSPQNNSLQSKPETVNGDDTGGRAVDHGTMKIGNDGVSTPLSCHQRTYESRPTTSRAVTCTTALVSGSSGSVRTTDSSRRYSSNFNPQLTSTPQRSAQATTSVTLSADSAKPDSFNFNGDGIDLTRLLDMIEKEAKGGCLKMLSTSEMSAAVRDLSDSPTIESSERQSGSSPTHSAKLCNNNPVYAARKHADKHGKCKRKQSVISRIGVPKATSSPIMIPKKCPRLAGRKGPAYREYQISEESSLFSVSSCQVAGIWRPWVNA